MKESGRKVFRMSAFHSLEFRMMVSHKILALDMNMKELGKKVKDKNNSVCSKDNLEMDNHPV